MTDKKKTSQKVEDTLACTAFAEEGEPCPLDSQKEAGVKQETGESLLHAVEDDLACTAFSDQNEKCPLAKQEGP